MYQGNWSCSTCGGAITELPFEPRSASGLTCRACYAKRKEAEKTADAAPAVTTAAEPMPEGDVPNFDEASVASEPPPAEDAFAGLDATDTPPSGEKPKFEGDWQCAHCCAPITSLPFQPRSTNNLKCLDCFKASKDS